LVILTTVVERQRSAASPSLPTLLVCRVSLRSRSWASSQRSLEATTEAAAVPADSHVRVRRNLDRRITRPAHVDVPALDVHASFRQ
jgi:hypothetical protein